METRRFDGTDARKILAGMVSDPLVCSRVAKEWPEGGEGLFAAEWSNIVGGLVVDYFRKYNQPPRRQLVSLFEEWARNTPAPDAEVESVERFLRGVFDEEHQDSGEYLLDLAKQHFGKVALQRTFAAAQADLAVGKVEEAHERIDKFRRINLGSGSYTVPTADLDVWANAFNVERNRPLITYRGALGEFIGDSFQRGRLLSFMASEKVGKTAWLVDATYRALKNFCYVAYFDCGDGSDADLLPRLGCRATGKAFPRGGTFSLPVAWDDDEVEFEDREIPEFDFVDGYTELREIACDPQALRTSYHPSESLSVADLDSQLWQWEQESGWVPDVVICDYADIMAPPKGVKDKLDQVDGIWSGLHSLAQRRHCLVITATQASALSYGNESGLLTKKHFSGRRTKLAHVNGMLGINVSPEEKERGLSRINWIVRRGAQYNERHYVRVAGHMAIATPAIFSKRPVKKAEESADTDSDGKNG